MLIGKGGSKTEIEEWKWKWPPLWPDTKEKREKEAGNRRWKQIKKILHQFAEQLITHYRIYKLIAIKTKCQDFSLDLDLCGILDYDINRTFLITSNFRSYQPLSSYSNSAHFPSVIILS